MLAKFKRKCLSLLPGQRHRKLREQISNVRNVLMGALEGLAEVLEGVPAPGLQGAIKGMLFIAKRVELANQNLEDFRQLGESLKNYKTLFAPCKVQKLPPAIREAVDVLLVSLKEPTGVIQEVENHCQARRILESTDDAELFLRQLQRLDRALTQFNCSVTLYTACLSEEHYNHSLISQLQVESGAYFDSRSRNPVACLPNTRVGVRNHISQWLFTKSSKPVFWLRGRPGTGKSCIAQSIAEQYRDEGRLAGHFFFSRDILLRHSAENFATTLTVQLCSFDIRLARYVATKLRADAGLGNTQLRRQFSKLVIEPLQELEAKSSALFSPMLVIIDGLDECSDTKHATEVLLLLLTIPISTRLGQPLLKFLVTSRPERHLVNALGDHMHSIELHDLDVDDARDDIAIYFKHEFALICAAFPECFAGPTLWPEPHAIQVLSDRSKGLFIYASTIIKFVGDEDFNPTERLNIVLKQNLSESSGIYEALDTLYKDVLLRAPRSIIQSILPAVILGGRPFSPLALEILLGLHPGNVSIALRRLHSILIVSSDRDAPIRMFHKSFYDFLTTQSRSGEFYVNPEQHHGKLALACMRTIASQSPFCSDLSGHIALESAIHYALLFWTEHFRQSDHSDEDLMGPAFDFIKSSIWSWFDGLIECRLLDHLLECLGYLLGVPLAPELSTFLYHEMDRLGVLISTQHITLRYVDPLRLSEHLHHFATAYFTDDQVIPYSYLYHLGMVKRRLFEFHERAYRDVLDQALEYGSLALQAAPPHNSDRPLLIAEVARCHCHLGRRGLEKSLPMFLEALESMNTNDPKKPTIHISYSRACLKLSRSPRRPPLIDIAQAIEHSRFALDLVPHDHSILRSTYLLHLGECLELRFQQTHQENDILDAITAASAATLNPLASPLLVFQSAYDLARYQSASPSGTSLPSYLRAVEAAQRISWCAYPVDVAFKQIEAAHRCAREATSEAIACGQPETALLCARRACFLWWFGRMNIRTPFLPTVTESPNVLELAAQLELGEREQWIYLPSDDLPQADNPEDRTILVQRHQQLLDQLLGASECASDVLASVNIPAGGSLVVLNASSRRCDGLLLQSNNHRLDSFQLPIEVSTLRDLALRARQLSEHDDEYLFEKIWNLIVHPVIQALGLEPRDEPPRVWWCLTGLFADLPLHAARTFTSMPKFATDYMISSYLPTLSPLPCPPTSGQKQGFTFLDFCDPPFGREPQPQVFRELENVVPNLVAIRDGSPTVSSVIDQLHRSAGVHISAPAEHRHEDPASCRFVLTQDAILELQHFRDDKDLPSFVYLSTYPPNDAWGTDPIPCRVGYDLYNVGVPSVVAQQSTMTDDEASLMAAHFYAELRKLDLNPHRAATALHRAYIALRGKAVKAKMIARYIHIGI